MALGNDTVHAFTAFDPAQGMQAGCGFYETHTQNYQGTGSMRQLLKQMEAPLERGAKVRIADVPPVAI